MRKLKIFLLLLICCLIQFLPASRIKADFIQPSYDVSLFENTDNILSIEKIIFSKVKINRVLNISHEDYLQEIAFFFNKLGFVSPPVSYVLFENGDIGLINKSWAVNQFENNLKTGALFILLAYQNEFDFTNFNSAFDILHEELSRNTSALTVKGIDNIELREFKINTGNGSTSVEFSDALDTAYIKNIYSDIDFGRKISPDLKIQNINIQDESNPKEIVIADIEIKNGTGVDLIFGINYPIKIGFKENSDFFVNEKWENQRIAKVLNQGFIMDGETKAFPVEILSPVFPGKIEGEIILEYEEKVLSSKEFAFEVKDIGQKILTILPTDIGYLNVRQEPTASSPDIGRAGEGLNFTFTDISNGFYKIDYYGKDGWVSGNYIRVIKE